LCYLTLYHFIPICRVRSLCIVDEYIMQMSFMFISLFKNLSNCKYLFNSRSIWGKFHWTFFQFFPTMSDNLLFNNIVDILYVMLNSVTGLWLVHFNLSPFLYIGCIVPSVHCAGSSSLSHIFKINLYSFCFKVFPLFCQFWGYIICTISFARF